MPEAILAHTVYEIAAYSHQYQVLDILLGCQYSKDLTSKSRSWCLSHRFAYTLHPLANPLGIRLHQRGSSLSNGDYIG